MRAARSLLWLLGACTLLLASTATLVAADKAQLGVPGMAGPIDCEGTLAGRPVAWRSVDQVVHGEGSWWSDVQAVDGEEMIWEGRLHALAAGHADRVRFELSEGVALVVPPDRTGGPQSAVLRRDDDGKPHYVARVVAQSSAGLITLDTPLDSSDGRIRTAAAYLAADVAPQTGYWSCGMNTAARLLRTRGHDVTYPGLKKQLVGDAEFEGREYVFGIRPRVLRDFLAEYEPCAKFSESSTLDALVAHVDAGTPVLALVKVGERPLMHVAVPALHWLIVHGHDAKDRRLTITDTNGRIYRMPIESFERMWDWRVDQPMIANMLEASLTRPRTFVWIDDAAKDDAATDRGINPPTTQPKPSDD